MHRTSWLCLWLIARHALRVWIDSQYLEAAMAQSDEGLSTALIPPATAHHGLDDRDAEIARRAYQLYEQRGRAHGGDIDDWLLAERELGVARDSTTA
jgi:hypothetical protein